MQLETLSQLLMIHRASSEERADTVSQLAQTFVLQGTDIFFPFPYVTSEKYRLIFDNDCVVDLQGMAWESDDAKRVSLAFLNHTVKAMCLISEQQKTLVDILVARDAQKIDGSC